MWDSQKQAIWTLVGQDLRLKHSKMCLNSKKKKAPVNVSMESENRKSFIQMKSYHFPEKLVIQD